MFCILIFKQYVTIRLDIENARLKVSPITVANDPIEMLLLFGDKTICQNNQKKQYIYKPFSH